MEDLYIRGRHLVGLSSFKELSNLTYLFLGDLGLLMSCLVLLSDSLIINV